MLETALPFSNYREMKAKMHSQILEEMDLESLNKLEESVARQRVYESGNLQHLYSPDRRRSRSRRIVPPATGRKCG